MVILLVVLEVTLQAIDVGGQQCNLHFRRTGIAFFLAVLFQDFRFLFYGQSHGFAPICTMNVTVSHAYL